MKRSGLTALKVRRAQPYRKKGRIVARRFGDGGGLYLVASEKGRSWLFLWERGGRQRAMGLGSASTLSLADARIAAAEARRAVLEGRDPRVARNAKRAGTLTFGEAADQYIATNEASWRSPKHRYQWRQTLTVYAAPLRLIPVSEITPEDVLRVLKPLWSTKLETAMRLRGRVERVLDWARAKGLREGSNPALWKGNLKDLLPAPGPKRKRVVPHKAMPFADVPAFMVKLRAMEGIAPRALEYTILTAARAAETYGARWSEISFADEVWTIPGSRMKGGVEHQVPLPHRAVAILREAEQWRISDYVFPGRRDNRPLSPEQMNLAMKRLGVPADQASVHGFRSSFRDWCGDCTSFPREVAEAALAHLVGDDTERRYRRGTAFEKRRGLMTAWGDFLEPKAGAVVMLRGRRAR